MSISNRLPHDFHKFAPRSVRGVFAGYELESGMRWGGKMLVWELDKFRIDHGMQICSKELTEASHSGQGCDGTSARLPLKTTFEGANGDREALIKASWEKEGRRRRRSWR